MYESDEPAACPVCNWRGRISEAVTDTDNIQRCPVLHCRAPLERISDTPVVVDSEEYFRPMI